MTHIKSWMIAAACTLVLPAFAAETNTAKAADQAKAEAKKPAASREKIAGQVSAPVVTKDSVDKSGDVAKDAEPFTLKDARWAPKADRS